MPEIQGYKFSIDLDDGGMTRSLKEIRNEARLLKTEMKANFAEINSTGNAMKAYAGKVSDAKRAIEGQRTVIERLKREQEGLDTSTIKGREAYAKYERQINQARTEIANLSAQQKRAADSSKLYSSGVLEVKKSLEQTKKLTAAYVESLKSEGRVWTAQRVQLNGLATEHAKMAAQLELEQKRLRQIDHDSGAASSAYAEQKTRIVQLTAAMNKNESEAKQVSRSISGMSNRMLAVRDSASKLGKSVKGEFQRMRSGAIAASTGVAILGAAVFRGAKLATGLQNEYKKTTNLLVTGGERSAEAIRNVAKMQKDGSRYSLKYGESQESIARGYQELVKRGYSSAQALGAMKTELQASVASGDDFADVVQVSSQTLESFGMRAKSTEQMTKNTKEAVNDLAYAADMTATDFHSIGKGMEYVGATAHNMKFSLAETSAALGVLSNNGLEADKAGTGLRKVLVSLADPGKAAREALGDLGLDTQKKIDAAFKDSKGNFKSIADITAKVYQLSAGMSSSEQGSVFKRLFGTTGMQAGQILGKNADELRQLTANVKEAGKSGTYVQELANKNSTTALMSQKRFKAAFDNLSIMFGSKLLPYMSKAADGMTKLFGQKSFNDDIKRSADGVANLAKSMLDIGLFATRHYDAVKAFAGALAAVWAVNKLAKFTSSMMVMRDLFKSSAGTVAAETLAIDANTRAKERNAEVSVLGATKGSTRVGKAVNTVEAAVSDASLLRDTSKSGSMFSKLKGASKFGKIAAGGVGLADVAFAASDLLGMTKKTAGSHIGAATGSLGGTAAGAAIGSMIAPGIGTAIGAALGGIGGEKIGRMFGKAFQKGFSKQKVTTKVRIKELTSAADKADKRTDKKLDDLKELRKMGALSKKEYDKQVRDLQNAENRKSTIEGMSAKDRKVYAEYYGQQKSKVERKWNNKIEKDFAKYGTDSIQVQKDLNGKKNAIDRLRQKFVTKVTAQEAREHVTAAGRISAAARVQIKATQKLTSTEKKLNRQQLVSTVASSDKARKTIIRNAESVYNRSIKAAEKKKKRTVELANEEYSGNSKWAKKQRQAVIAHALATQNRSDKAAYDKYKSTVKSANKEYQEAFNAAKKKNKGVTSQAVSEYENTRDNNKKTVKNTSSTWDNIITIVKNWVNHLPNGLNALIKAINHIFSAFGGKNLLQNMPRFFNFATGTGVTAGMRRPILAPTMAILNDGNDSPETGNKEVLLHRNGQAETIHGRYTQRLVQPGEEILNASEARDYGFVHYASGTGFLDGIGNFIKGAVKGVSGFFSDAFGSLKDKLKAITGFVANPMKSFNSMFTSVTSLPGSVAKAFQHNNNVDLKKAGQDWWSTVWNVISGAANDGGGAGGPVTHSPGAGWSVSSGFGYRGPTAGGLSIHDGTDYSGGRIVHAMNTGDVISAGGAPGGWGGPNGIGQNLRISGGGLNYIYQELNGKNNSGARFLVKVGQHVNAGDPIAVLGPDATHVHVGASRHNVFHNNPATTADWLNPLKVRAPKELKKSTKSPAKGLTGFVTKQLKSLGILQWVKKMLAPLTEDSFGSGGGDYDPDMIRKAAKAMHVNPSDSFIKLLQSVIQTESHGQNIVQSSALHDVNDTPSRRARGILQYTPGTFNNYAVSGHHNIMNPYDQLLAFFNNSDWRHSIGRNQYNGRLDWMGSGPTGHRRFANGGLSTKHQMAEISEFNMPEMVIPLSAMKSSRGYELLGKTAAIMAKRDGGKIQHNGGSNSDNKQLSKIANKLDDLITLLGTVINNQSNPVPAVVGIPDLIKKINAYQKTQSVNTKLGRGAAIDH
ncbi:phage tail tape measure protein [Secundilactobacillus kimchicus]|uniref:phage tail tape measure protein n=1 Tax=Secundilactobacillus kimchicus TaxID=528209 RepID=UPI001C02CFB6|nr:phage tail tape measure protein [Secundilactobacillus kimchicus]MBT9670679.1 phage tail tape measure protein [Secundilactobacillus kimchicus]